MFSNVFLDSNKMRLAIKLGDQLSLSLRENVEILSFDKDEVSFLTESGNIIQGTIDFKNQIFENIVIEDASVFEDHDAFDSLINKKIRGLTNQLLENSSEAQNVFEDILDTWKARTRFDRVCNRLSEKSYKLAEHSDLLNQDEFRALEEIKPQLINFIKENKEDLIKISEVFNSVVLADVISKALNLPRVEYEELEESIYPFKNRNFESVYEVICRQELIKKELLESKKNFETMWVTDKVADLIGMIFSKDEDEIKGALVEAITENPYFALANKTKITKLFENAISLNENINENDIRQFTSMIFEMKKPIKEEIISVLNTKYGINIQNLKANPSFSDLAKTQKVIFETLSKLAPRKSILKTTLKEFSNLLGNKAGVDCIDLNEWISEIFLEAEMLDVLSETNLLGYMDFSKVAKDLSNISLVLQSIQQQTGIGAGPQQPGMEGAPQPGMGAQPQTQISPEMAMNSPDDPSVEDGPYDADGTADFEGDQDGGDEDGIPHPQMSPDQAAMEAGDEAQAEFGEEEHEDAPPSEDVSRDQLQSSLSDLESLISDLQSELGTSQEGEEEFEGEPEEDFEEEPEEEEGEGSVEIDTGEGDDEVHIDKDSHNDDDEGDNETDDEEEDFPPKK
jgi:hypothetical protein